MTYNTVLAACERAAQWEEAALLLAEMKATGAPAIEIIIGPGRAQMMVRQQIPSTTSLSMCRCLPPRSRSSCVSLK